MKHCLSCLIYYLHIKKKNQTNKGVIHRTVSFTRIWKNTLRSRGKEHSKKLLCQISVIKFAGNSADINFCPRRSWNRASTKDSLALKCWNAKTVQNRLVYHFRDENNQRKRRFLREKLQQVRNIQKKRNATPRMRSVAAKIVTAQLHGWHILLLFIQYVSIVPGIVPAVSAMSFSVEGYLVSK